MTTNCMCVMFVLRREGHCTVTVDGQVPILGSRVFVDNKWWVVREISYHVDRSESTPLPNYYARVELDY